MKKNAYLESHRKLLLQKQTQAKKQTNKQTENKKRALTPPPSKNNEDKNKGCIFLVQQSTVQSRSPEHIPKVEDRDNKHEFIHSRNIHGFPTIDIDRGVYLYIFRQQFCYGNFLKRHDKRHF